MEEKTMTLCKCGCGEAVKRKKNGTYSDYIQHHFFRVNKPMKGKKRSKEDCQKMSDQRKGVPKSEEHKRKIGEGNKGKKLTEETKEKLRKAHTGKTLSEDHKKNIGKAISGENNGFYGRKHTEEAKQKMRESTLGKYDGENNPNYGKEHTEEAKKRIGDANRGRVHTEESKQKMAESTRGYHHTPESIEKMSGENAPNWKGGISFEPYCIKFNNSLKRKIRERDNNTCQNPHCNKKVKNGDVHHINYNKKNSDEKNLITLCVPCHRKSGHNREYWEDFYKNIIDIKYKKNKDSLYLISNNKN